MADRINPARVHHGGSASELSVFGLVRMATFFILPFIIIDALPIQLQMFLTGGDIVVGTAYFKGALLAALALVLAIRLRISDSAAALLAFAFASYLVCAFLFHATVVGFPMGELVTGYSSYYTLYLSCLLALTCPLRLSSRRLVVLLVVLACICSALGIAQFITQEPLVYAHNADRTFEISAFQNIGSIRAFSFFTAPGLFGTYSSLCAVLMFTLCLRKWKPWLSAPLLLLFLFATYTSGIRTDLVGTICSLVSAVILVYNPRSFVVRYLPVLYIPVGLVVGAYAYWAASVGNRGEALTATGSFQERLSEWAYYVGTLRQTEPSRLLLGSGWLQAFGSHSTNAAPFPIDNFVLATIMNSGIIGLLFMIAIFYLLWRRVLAAMNLNSSVLVITVAASLSSFWCLGLFTIATTQLAAIYLVFALSDESATTRTSSMPALRTAS